jgi:hemoglobin/transferrin/lactoferrin receptor protein
MESLPSSSDQVYRNSTNSLSLKHLAQAAVVLAAFLLLPLSLGAQEPEVRRVQPVDSIPDIEFPTMFALDPVVVTATRSPRSLFETPTPVSRIDVSTLRIQGANNVADVFRGIQGLDVVGVGPSQVRPTIRGQRGQRILLLSDGLRLQNSRRQQDFGEIPALIDVTTVERVEVVRGPASVLYGSDAIGGVVNVITRAPDQEGTHGTAAYRYGSAGGQNKGALNLWGKYSSFDFRVGGTYRDAGAYEAPSGDFGDISLDDPVTVNDTGVTDWSLDLYGGWTINESHRLFAKWEHYDSQDSGFGYVAPADYAPDQPEIQITYPYQKFDKISVGYGASDLDFALADRVDVLAYTQMNERELVFDFGLEIPMGPGMVGNIDINDVNNTDINTYGFRIEAKKLAWENLLWTYGVDYFLDDASGTDVSTETMTGFGPFPIVSTDSTPSLPEARLSSLGLFVQGDYQFGDRGSLIAGARYQRASSQTFETPGLDVELYDQSDDTFVGAVNGILNISSHWAAVGTVGRGFRWPNLVERYFEGSTPEGSGDQTANPDLKPETSLNVDLGLRYRRTRVAFETFVFRNDIRDAIRVALVEEGTPSQRPLYRNENVDQFIYKGVEVGLEVFATSALSVDLNYTWLDSENKTNPELPVAEGSNNQLNAALRWTDPQGRFHAQYDVRYQSDQEDAIIEGSANPVGDMLPGFTVHNVRAGFRFFAGGFENRLDLALTNLTDELYAEAANSTFFRPEPRRGVALTLSTAF